MREVIIPQQQVFEDIRMIEEAPGHYVRATVGFTDANGVFIVPQQYSIFTIDGDMYQQLIAATGTYQNSDLWPYIDQLRNRK